MSTRILVSCFFLVAMFSVGRSITHGDLAVPVHPPNSTLDYLYRVLNGLDLTMTFFNRETENVNLDAAIGTRIVEGTLSVLLHKLESTEVIHHVPTYVITHIRELRDSSRHFSNIATPYIKRQELEYYQKIGQILSEGLFELDYESRDISYTAPVWPYNPREVMREDESDDCLAEIFGTRNNNQLTCAVSDTCWKQMTNIGYSSYSLSHQILYLEVAERFGCQMEMHDQMYSHGQTSLRGLHNMFCANMLVEAERIAEGGFQETSQDLFMEQASLCGMLGFRDFFNTDWAIQILSWQDKEDGCYKWDKWPLIGHLAVPRHVKSSQHRIKREEKRVSRGCLCHRTTVAAGVLAQYVRYILEVWIEENQLV